MSAYDLIRWAKPTQKAYLDTVEIYRKQPNQPDTLITLSLPKLKDERTTLKNQDRIVIKTNGALTKYKTITISGEIRYPGTYIARNNEKLSDIIQRAGGYTQDAFLKGAVFTRKNTQQKEALGHQRVLEEEKKRLIFDQKKATAISTDYQIIYAHAISFLEDRITESKGRAIITLKPIEELKDSPYNIPIEDGDELVIPEIPETVQVVGGVQQPTALLYHKGKKTNYYVKNAGSYSEFAQKNKYYIIKANGSVETNNRVVDRGDTIYVPEKVKVYVNWIGLTSKLTTIIFNTLVSLKTLEIIK